MADSKFQSISDRFQSIDFNKYRKDTIYDKLGVASIMESRLFKLTQ